MIRNNAHKYIFLRNGWGESATLKSQIPPTEGTALYQISWSWDLREGKGK